ncbi:MAG: copper resistance protein CopC, partial [Chloroflexota bacterium]|nr:copper resistance protein CopC [Chloroflexota bacterium]
LIGPGLPGSINPAVYGHAQLVSSSPGAGEVLDEAPAEVRLIFSEPPDGRHSSLDVLDEAGEPVVANVGDADPADRYALVAEAPALAHGTYMVVWRALSSADGHTTSGFFTFGVGMAPQEGMAHGGEGEQAAAGRLHPTHTPTDAAIEVVARVMGYLGFMLAFGLAFIALAVVRPVSRRWPRRILVGQGLLLLVGAVGAAILTFVVSRGPALDPVSYLFETRTGNLLLGRVAIGLAGAGAVLGLLRVGRPAWAVGAAGLFGLVALGVLVSGGHAAAHIAPSPSIAMLVHVAAASVWLAGVVLLLLVAFSRHPRTHSLASLVPRFSALALVSVGLLGMTGIYTAWVETRDFTSLDSDYSVALAAKVLLALGALALGGLNFLEGGGRSIWPVGFRPRILVETVLAAGVLVATANLASGAPPAQERPVPIAPTAASAAQGSNLGLEIQPGRPGPNRFWAVVPDAGGDGTTVELHLQRADQSAGESRIPLRPSPDDPTRFVTGGGLLPANSSWDASVVVKEDDIEATRSRFLFSVDALGVSEGRQRPIVDPALIVAVLLVAGALIVLAYTLAGGVLPRVERTVGRAAVLAGALIGGTLGVVLLLAAPRL